MFIVIEGIDGSGKGTQVQRLKKHFEGLGKTVLLLDFPRYSEPSSYFVSRYLNGDYGKWIWAKGASIFYALDRFDTFASKKIDLQAYDYVISNRFVSSSMIHQAGKIESKNERDAFLGWLDDFEHNILGTPRPDRIIFLNVPPHIGQELVLKKEARDYLKDGKKMDIHEEDADHLTRARLQAISIVQTFPNWVQIDCVLDEKLLSIDAVTQKILSSINDYEKNMR